MSSKDLTDALAALSAPSNAAPREPMAARGAADAAKASALLPGGVGAAGGSSSNMTETSYADRTWHSAVLMPSSDGILFARLLPVKTVKFSDASGNQFTYEFKAPT